MVLETKRLQLFFFLEVLYYLEHLLTNYTNTIDMITTPIISAISTIQTTTAMNIIKKSAPQDGTHVEVKPSQDLPTVPSTKNIIIEYSFYALVSLVITAITVGSIYGVYVISRYLFS